MSNTNNPSVSVIVPIYNVEIYLKRCVDSILSQTLRDIEVILVDDGSPDNCGTICDDYAKKDTRVHVLHKENGGISDARNLGLKYAKGEYVCFIDSDDFIDEDMLNTLYRLVEENEVDMSVCGIRDYYEGQEPVYDHEERAFVCSGIEGLRYTLEGRLLPGSVCSKLIRRTICDTLSFPVGKTYEDAFYTPELFFKISKVAITTKKMYNYWHRADSVTTKPFSAKNMDVIEAYQYTYDVVSKKCPELMDVAQFRLCWANFVVLDKLLVTDNYATYPQYSQVVKFLKNKWWWIFRSPYFRTSRRVAAVALKVNVRLYRMLAVANTKKYGGTA